MKQYDVTALPFYEDGCYQGLVELNENLDLSDCQHIAQDYVANEFAPGVQIRCTDGSEELIGTGGPNNVEKLAPLTEQGE